MAIAYPLAAPNSPVARAIRWQAASVVAVSRSPFTLTEDVQEWGGQNWAIDVSLPPMSRDEAEGWVSFLLALNGRAGTFTMGDPSAKAALGTAPGVPLVDGAQAAGTKTLATKGWTSGQTGILLPGSFIQLGSGATARMHKVLTAANSDGAGKATLDIWPSLRNEGVANNAAIVTANCVNLWRLATNDVSWNVGEAQIYGIDFSAVGAL